MSCPACNEQKVSFFGSKDGHDLVECRHCGLIYAAPMPTDEFLKSFYETWGQECNDERPAGYYTEVMDLIETRASSGMAFLEIGCGSGDLLAEARKRGFLVRGIDPSAARVAAARNSYDLDVNQGDFPDARIADRTYDVAYMGHVIEHLPDPATIIDHVRDILTPGGLVCVLCPNAGAPSFRIRKRHHHWVILPEHVTYWSGRSLSSFMERHGFATEVVLTRDPDDELKNILSYVLRDAWRKPSEGRTRASNRPFIEGRGGASVLAYRALKVLSRNVGPLFGRMGGNELVGIFRKRDGNIA